MTTPRSLRLTALLALLVAAIGALDCILSASYLRGGPTFISGAALFVAIRLAGKREV